MPLKAQGEYKRLGSVALFSFDGNLLSLNTFNMWYQRQISFSLSKLRFVYTEKMGE